jgi:hypothetical protein
MGRGISKVLERAWEIGRYEPVGQSHASERGFVFVIQYGARYLHIWQTVVEGLAMRVALV